MSENFPTPASSDEEREAFWRDYLTHPDTLQRVGRRLFSRIPTNPRCQLCAAPFAGTGGQLMKLIGKAPSSVNPNMCNTCERVLLKHRGGAEVTCSVLFADIRGSTALGERMTPGEFRATLTRFFTTASETVYAHSGIIDKFVGDEIVATFPPFLGEDHAARAIETARHLLRATGHTDPDGPWAPVGAGVGTGRMWFGAIGEGSHVEITVVGDVVNTTARLAGAAEAGEVLVAVEAATAAGLDPGLERRTLALKGKELTTEVISLRA